MALPTLLRRGGSDAERAQFAFDHAMAHRELLGGLSPLPRFSVLPYHIDPQWPTLAGWEINHQSAHNDMMANLPSWSWTFWVPRPPDYQLLPPPPAPGYAPDPIPLGLPSNLNLMDSETNEAARAWWEFTNHQEHLMAQSTLHQKLMKPYW